MNNEEKCALCKAFDSFQQMILDGYDVKEAFSEIVNNLLIKSYKDSITDGLYYIMNIADFQINKLSCNCKTCNGECDESIN